MKIQSLAVALFAILLAGAQAQAQIYFEDMDGDGYGNDSITVDSNYRPLDYVEKGGDCDDRVKEVHPGKRKKKEFYTVSRPGGGFDYDCDGVEKKQNSKIGSCGGFPMCDQNKTIGWIGFVPACGEPGEFMEDCDYRNPGVCKDSCKDHSSMHCHAETKAVKLQGCR